MRGRDIPSAGVGSASTHAVEQAFTRSGSTSVATRDDTHTEDGLRDTRFLAGRSSDRGRQAITG
ncbi:hypothetical protein QLQ12_24315 [Actinoplanes sp. NEAU-A12]|uniref:Uncharacterized protein n=1 Tax=Actinoplanes sandaracinus TaxID=3045177 RepID=A0ABT6WQ35_9ACTN|nr:hypothetical protein [Actinoplanes sandaracinus]MDI6101750.1 hypothetical protein [Actinoplanes sandaracinus]